MSRIQNKDDYILEKERNNMGLVRKNYVITGGPCTGKTAVIKALKADGFIIVPEAARLVKRRNMIHKGPLPEKNFEDFEDEVIDAQTILGNKHPGAVRFHDRSFCDNIAYYNHHKLPLPEHLIEILNLYLFDKIFFLSQLDFYTPDKYRPETKEEADILHRQIREAYSSQGYDIIEIPLFPVPDRIRLIKECIQDDLDKLSLTLKCTTRELKVLK